jgi:ABC-type antimicrobial peptide transport system permease subunit
MFVCAQFAISQNRSKIENVPITDSGWGKVEIGALLIEVEEVLGKLDKYDEVNDLIFVNYQAYDLLIVSFIKTKKIGAIYFSFTPDRKKTVLKTDKGISLHSTEDDVIRSYGKPKKITETQKGRNLYYEGIRFTFRKKNLFQILIQDKAKEEFL